MSMLKLLVVIALAVPAAALADAGTSSGTPIGTSAPRLGQPLGADEIAKWNLTVYPDGRGLPTGTGNATAGRAIYEAQCAECHGAGGRGGTAEELVSEPQSLKDPDASKAIGPYWPFATTVFDFIRRSMPPQRPGSLSPDQVYAVTAYLLAANKVIGEGDNMTAETLPKVKMPNRDGFDWIDAKP